MSCSALPLKVYLFQILDQDPSHKAALCGYGELLGGVTGDCAGTAEDQDYVAALSLFEKALDVEGEVGLLFSTLMFESSSRFFVIAF